MTIYVTDANIFIDLIYAELLSDVSLLGLQLATTTFILDELEPAQQLALAQLIEEGCLVVHEVVSLEVDGLNMPKGLSMPDRSVLCLAFQQEGHLLSGDGLVRKTATSMGVTVYGLLWLFDQLVESTIISPEVALTKLTFLIDEKASRQPIPAYHQRVERWKK